MGDILCAINKAVIRNRDTVFYHANPCIKHTALELLALQDTHIHFEFIPGSPVRIDNQTISTGTDHPQPFVMKPKKQWNPGKYVAVYNNKWDMPYPDNDPKYFTQEEDRILIQTSKDNNALFLGQRHNDFSSLSEAVEVLLNCKYAVGIEGGWTHLAHMYRIPYFAFRRNKESERRINMQHTFHPTLRMASFKEILRLVSE